MGKYRKKPVTIEAFQIKPTWETDEKPGWVMQGFGFGVLKWAEVGNHPTNYIRITTPKGNMKAKMGDWIIRGVQGELYCCKPEIFAQTYEPVE